MAAVASSDLIFYLAANRPENDTTTSGGAKDTDVQLITRDAFSWSDKVDLVSAAGGDTQNCVIAGYLADGSWVQETVALNGTGHVQTTNTFSKVLKCVLASAAAGAVTVAKYNSGSPVTVFTIPAGEKGQQALFLLATAEAVGGATKYFYEKVFVHNANLTDSLVAGVVWLSEDEDAELTMDCEMSASATVTNGSETTANRVTEPTTGGAYSWGQHASQGAGHTVGDAEDGNLSPSEAQGVWVKLTLAAGRTPEKQVDWAPSIAGAAS